MSFFHQHATDDVVRAMAITPTFVFGTAVAAYPVTNMFTDDLANPFKAATVIGGTRLTLKFDFGSPVALRFASIHHLNLTQADGLTIRLASDSSGTFAAPAARANFDFTYSGIADDGFSIDAYIASALAAATARQFWYLDIFKTTALELPQIARLWLSTTLRTLPHGLDFADLADPQGHPAIVHPTAADTQLIYPRGTRDPRSGIAGTIRTTTTGRDALRTWERLAGQSGAVPIVPFSSIAEAHFVRWSEGYLFQPRYQAPSNLYDIPVSWTHVGRGLPL